MAMYGEEVKQGKQYTTSTHSPQSQRQGVFEEKKREFFQSPKRCRLPSVTFTYAFPLAPLLWLHGIMTHPHTLRLLLLPKDWPFFLLLFL